MPTTKLRFDSKDRIVPEGMVLPPFDPICLPPASDFPIPDYARCEQYVKDAGMPDHIWRHSLQVANIAVYISRQAEKAGKDIDIQAVQASALLHDIAKFYTIENGGFHNQLGGAWVMELTGNPVIAMGVTHHVYWPFTVDVEKFFLPLVVGYADKRVMHDTVTTINGRFDDLLVRYGKTELRRSRINSTRAQALILEKKLEEYIQVELDENTFDRRWLVK